VRINIALGLLVAALASTTCDESLSKLAGPTPNLEPTFASVQQEIFETTDVAGRTACVACHTNVGRNPAGGLNLNRDAAYDQLVNKASGQKAGTLYVAPGDPENSYLVQKLDGTAGIVGRRMPFNGPPYLSDGQILIVKRWIETGAPRN
jgi:hypothetical protein